jgi:pimeloyl-ACP methyl ester carboxylesterase
MGNAMTTASTEPSVRDETIELDGLRLHYRDWGDPSAPPVVLLHAYLQHARTWDTVARGLADRFRVIALDHRGFGESDWAPDYTELRLVGDLAGLADSLGLERFSAVGFSMSASTAASYALLFPERIDRLVLFEGFPCDVEGEPPWVAAMHAHMGVLRTLSHSYPSPEAAIAAFRPLTPRATTDELRQWITDGLKQDASGRWVWRHDPSIRSPNKVGRFDAPPDVLRARVSRLDCPMLLLAAEEGWMVESTKQVAALNPRARFEIVPDAGHWLPLENPSGFLEAVRKFLGERGR